MRITDLFTALPEVCLTGAFPSRILMMKILWIISVSYTHLYGIYGGQYISETLMNELIHLEEQYEYYKKDPEFQEELHRLLVEYAGRPSLLYYAEKMTKDLGGAKIYLKREDLNHTGAHKINNVLGQALLAKKMGCLLYTSYNSI